MRNYLNLKYFQYARINTRFTEHYFTNLSRYYLIQSFILMMLTCVAKNTYAGEGHDIFANTDADLISTLRGSGKRYIYLVEGFLSLATYIRTKNLMMLFGIVIVSFFLNVVLSVAGVQS